MSTLKVLVVGAGLTSSIIGVLLRKSQMPCQVTMWDKARGAGGRMSTSRSPKDDTCTVDVGAQYITATPEYLQSHNDFYNSLLMSKVLEPMSSRVEGLKNFPEGTRHFVAPNGMSSIVKHFLKEGQHQVKFSHHVSAIDRQGDSQWLVKTQCGREEVFDAVVLTMPVPQIMQLSGDVSKILDDVKNKEIKDGLKTVKYSARYALGMFFDATEFPDLGWDAKYLQDHDIFRYVAVDNRKRHRAQLPTAVVFHTSVEFGFKHVEQKLEDMQLLLMAKVKELFPDWPEPSSVKCHKWRYSQVIEAHRGSPRCVTVSSMPLLIAAGDGFTHSNLDGCIASASETTKVVSEFVTLKEL